MFEGGLYESRAVLNPDVAVGYVTEVAGKAEDVRAVKLGVARDVEDVTADVDVGDEVDDVSGDVDVGGEAAGFGGRVEGTGVVLVGVEYGIAFVGTR